MPVTWAPDALPGNMPRTVRTEATEEPQLDDLRLARIELCQLFERVIESY